MTEEIAAFAVGARPDDLTSPARTQLKIRILDSLGCAFAALDEKPVKGLRHFIDDFPLDGPCTLIGGGRSAPDRAALLNGALVGSLDFNDSFLAPGETCHPSDNLGAVLAAAELAGASGALLLSALAVAYEVQCRMSESAPVRQRGFDHTTYLGYSAAAGASRALGLDARATSNAIAMGGAALNALRVTRTGSLSHWTGLAASFAASAAMQAALLAQRGVSGPSAVIEGHLGFMDSVSGPFSIDWARASLGCVERTIVKRYSADVHSQTAIEAALELQRTHGFAAADIVWVEVDTFDVAYRLIGGGESGDKTLVFSKEDADHSLPYLIAVAFLDRAVMPAQFTRARLQRADVQQLLCRVTVRPRGEFSERFPASMPSRVTVTLNDGRTLGLSLPDYPGFHTRAPSWDDAEAKFTTLLSARFRERPLKELANAVQELDRVTTAELTRAIARMTASPRAALQAS